MKYDDQDGTEVSDWRDYQRLVLHELSRLNKNIEILHQKQVDQGLVIEGIKVRSGFLGMITGAISAIGYNITKTFIDR